MGYGALIAGLVEAGVSIYGDLSKKGPNTGEYSSTLNRLANQYILPYTNNPAFWNLNLPGMESESINYGLANAPAINQANMTQLQQMLNTALPGYQGMVAQMGANTSSMLQGQIPVDVQQAIARQAAAGSLASGIGGVSGAGAALTTNAATARSLGLTSLNLQETGANQLNNLLSMTKNYLMPQPVNPLSLLPLNDLVAAQQWSDQAQFKASEAAYTAKANAASARIGAPISQLAGVAGDIGALSTNLSKTNPQTGQTGFGLLGSLFGGGGNAGPGGAFGGSAGYDTSGTLPISSSFGPGD